MQTKEKIEKLISEIQFNNWEFVLRFDNDRPYLQIQFNAPCNVTGKVNRQYCRKWFLSYHMTDSEIISTAFKATITAIEHETREQFKWRNQPIFRPHLSIYDLYDLCEKNAIEKRKEIYE